MSGAQNETAYWEECWIISSGTPASSWRQRQGHMLDTYDAAAAPTAAEHPRENLHITALAMAALHPHPPR